MRLINLKGKKFGLLTVLCEAGRRWGYVQWFCRCKCGNRLTVSGHSLRMGHTRSCGCLNQKRRSERAVGNHYSVTHGHHPRGHRSPTYDSWANMIQRCTNPNAHYYPIYGGAGVGVCRAWRTFTGFLASMGERPKGTTLGRFKDSGDYKPTNCMWMTRAQQEHERKKKFRGGK